MTITNRAAGILFGLSTDTKPTTNVLVDTRFFETDTRRWFRFDGTDYLETGTPRADNEIFVYTQQDLEDAFGTDIEIPNGFAVSIILKADLILLSKPIKLGVGSSLFLSSDTILRTLVYTGTGALIQETTPGSGIGNIVINQIVIAAPAPDTNEFIDVTTAAASLVQINNTFFFDMDLGKVKGGTFTTFAVNFTDYNKGIICEDNAGVFINATEFNKTTGANTTGITIKSTLGENYEVTDTDGNFPADNFLIFYDPNVGSASRLIVSNCTTSDNQLFQPGAIQVNSAVIGTSGAGFTNFTTATAHGLDVGDEIVNSTFADSVYNGTFVVISVDTPLTGTVYEVEATFTATGTGQLFHQNADITINSVADNGSGNTRFTTAGAHGLVVGQAVVIKDFVTQTTYNQTAIVTAVDTPKTGVTFDADIVFVATDTGTINAASLDQTDPKVTATNNPNNEDSRTIASVEILNNANAFAPSNVGFGDFDFGVGGATVGASMENWELTNAQTAEVNYIGLEPFRGMIALVVNISTTSSKDYAISFAKNGIDISQQSGDINIPKPAQLILVANVTAVTNDTFRPRIKVDSGTDSITVPWGGYTIE